MTHVGQSDSERAEREFLEGQRYEDKFPERRLPDPSKRKLRCGPWTEREDGAMVCEKCGDIDYPGSTGPMGF